MRMSIVWLAALTCLLAWAGAAMGEDQQWLSYRAGSDGQLVTGPTPGAKLQIGDLGEGMKLPSLLKGRTIIARWNTPAVKAGFLWVAFGASAVNGPVNMMVIDANANGRLDDQKPLIAQPSVAGEFQSVEFKGVKVLLPGEDGPVAYHLNIQVNLTNNESRAVAQAAGWYEGTVRIEGGKFPCVLFDANANGVFNDAGVDFTISDRIKVDAPDGLALSRVGKYLQVGEKLYSLTVAPDGSWVKLAQPAAMEFGIVKVTGAVERFNAGGANGLFLVSVKDGQARIPAGKYRLGQWEAQRKDSSGMNWELKAVAAKPIEFEVAPGKMAELDLGDPLVGHVAASGGKDKNWVFSDPYLSGRRGEQIMLTCNQQRPPAPQLTVRNGDGSYINKSTFAYG